MKKILLLGVVLVSLLMTSCTKVGDVSGFVTLYGKDLEGAEVVISYKDNSSILHSAFSEADGYFEFLDLGAEISYDIEAYYEDEDGYTYSAFETFTLSNKENKVIILDLEEDEY